MPDDYSPNDEEPNNESNPPSDGPNTNLDTQKMRHAAMLEEYLLEDTRVGRLDGKVNSLLTFNAGAIVLVTQVQHPSIATHVVIAVFIAVISGLYALYPSNRFHALNIKRLVDQDVQAWPAGDLAEELAHSLKQAIEASREALSYREKALSVCIWSTGIALLIALIGYALHLAGGD